MELAPLRHGARPLVPVVPPVREVREGGVLQGGVAGPPPPPVLSKQEAVRYLHVHEHDEIDEARFRDWVLQASRLPGEKM